MLPQADLVLMPWVASVIAAIVSTILVAKLHRLFDTGVSFWVLIALGSIAIFMLSSFPAAFSSAADALADISVLVAGFSAYAASRWLKGQFELGAGHDG